MARRRFELYNVCNFDDFRRLWEEASAGKLSKEEVRHKDDSSRMEGRRENPVVLYSRLLPWAKEYQVATDPAIWYVGQRSKAGSNLLLPDSTPRRTDEDWRNYESLHLIAAPTPGSPGSPAPAAGRSPTKAERAALHLAWAAAHRRDRSAEHTADRPIRPLDVLMIRCDGTPSGWPIDGMFLVEPGGQVSLGPLYGRVDLMGQSPEQAEATVRKHLAETLARPVVQVTPFGHATRWRPAEPKTPCRLTPNDRLKISVVGTLPDQPIDGEFVVGSDGKVSLGRDYGSVSVKDLTPKDAEEEIRKELCLVLARPEVAVTLSGWETDRYLPAK